MRPIYGQIRVQVYLYDRYTIDTLGHIDEHAGDWAKAAVESRVGEHIKAIQAEEAAVKARLEDPYERWLDALSEAADDARADEVIFRPEEWVRANPPPRKSKISDQQLKDYR